MTKSSMNCCGAELSFVKLQQS